MTRRATDSTAKHYVYRCYDADGVLLYIGSTINVTRRLAAHRRGEKSASRWLQVCMTNHSASGPYPSRAAARRAEAAAITAERPLFNIHESRTPTGQVLSSVARYLVDRGHVDLARRTACSCWRETRDAGERDPWCAAHAGSDLRLVDA